MMIGTVHLSEVVVTLMAICGVQQHWTLFRRADWYLDELARSQLHVSRAVLVNMRSGRRNEEAWTIVHVAITIAWAALMTLPTFGSPLQSWTITLAIVGALAWARRASTQSERERAQLMAAHRAQIREG